MCVCGCSGRARCALSLRRAAATQATALQARSRHGTGDGTVPQGERRGAGVDAIAVHSRAQCPIESRWRSGQPHSAPSTARCCRRCDDAQASAPRSVQWMRRLEPIPVHPRASRTHARTPAQEPCCGRLTRCAAHSHCIIPVIPAQPRLATPQRAHHVPLRTRRQRRRTQRNKLALTLLLALTIGSTPTPHTHSKHPCSTAATAPESAESNDAISHTRPPQRSDRATGIDVRRTKHPARTTEIRCGYTKREETTTAATAGSRISHAASLAGATQKENILLLLPTHTAHCRGSSSSCCPRPRA